MGIKIVCKLAVMFFSLFLFFTAGAAQAAFSSNCDANNLNCSTSNNQAILDQQCTPTYGAASCTSMQSYLNAMQADCQSKLPTGIDCNAITNTQNGTAYYGNNAAAFAASTSSGTANPTDTLNNATANPTNTLNNATANPTNTLNSSGIYIPDNTGLPDPSGGIKTVLSNLLTWLLGILGTIAIISFVVSGITYLISTGEEEMIMRAKRNMTFAIIGVIVALAGFVIIQAVDYMLRGQSF